MQANGANTYRTAEGDACAHLRLPKKPEADGSHFGLRAIQQVLHSQVPVYGLPLGVANAVNATWGRTSFLRDECAGCGARGQSGLE